MSRRFSGLNECLWSLKLTKSRKWPSASFLFAFQQRGLFKLIKEWKDLFSWGSKDYMNVIQDECSLFSWTTKVAFYTIKGPEIFSFATSSTWNNCYNEADEGCVFFTSFSCISSRCPAITWLFYFPAGFIKIIKLSQRQRKMWTIRTQTTGSLEVFLALYACSSYNYGYVIHLSLVWQFLRISNVVKSSHA